METTKKQGRKLIKSPDKAQPKPKPKVLIQPGYATGDMFAIAAALIDDEELHVVISKGDENCKDPTDKADSIKKFYEDSRIAQRRIHLVEVTKLRGDNGKLKKAAREIQPHGKLEGVGYGTDYVAENFSENMQKKVRNAWKINSCNGEDKAIQEWLTEKRIPTSGERLLILWSRFSGKNGDIHIEHDTSYFGIRQIINRAVNMYDAIIITGDKGYQEERRDKGWRDKDNSKERGHQFDEIAADIKDRFGVSNVFNITEFWNDKGSNVLPKWDGNTRMGQFKLYEYFQKNFKEVKHLGFRSGNLEVMAMLGYKVSYMEEYGSEGGDRMAAWNDRREKILEDKKISKDTIRDIGYQRIQLTELPTRTGKFLQNRKAKIDEEVTEIVNKMDEKTKNELIKNTNKTIEKIIKEKIEDKIRRPDFTPGKKGGVKKPDEIRDNDKYLRGFSETDLDNIFKKYLHPKDWTENEHRVKREKKYYSEERKGFTSLNNSDPDIQYKKLTLQPSL